MPYYRTTDRKEQAKALAGVLLVHIALGAAILSGLNVRTVGEAVERLKTFNITEPPPPPPVEPPPPPRLEESGAPRDEAAPANLRSPPTPVIAPKPRVRLPVRAARTAGAAAEPGPGTGAGGEGSGFGGGGAGGSGSGAGSGAGYTPAQRITKIPDSEYRRIVAASGMRSGRVGLTLKVNIDGRPSDCRIARSSGSPSVDALMCQLALQHVRFRPARDPEGQPVAQDMTWFPDWSPNR